MGAARIFDVDETAIETTREHKQVIVAKGSMNVWHKDVKTHFHLSFVACGSANGFVVPPLFIFPGKSVNDDIFDEYQIPGAGVVTTEKAIMTATLFARWLQYFSDAIPSPIRRPLLLVMDGCSSHISLSIVDVAEHLGIILVCLPPNGTHLLQLMDVAVFSPFKTTLKILLDKLLPSVGKGTIDKQTALGVAALAWNYACLGSNLAAGFRSCGIFPLSRVNMHAKLANFGNGLPASHKEAAWLKVSVIVQREILVRPARAFNGKKRKRKNTGGLTRQRLEQEEASSKKRTTRKRKAAPLTVTQSVLEAWF